jgi:DNA modification methylase
MLMEKFELLRGDATELLLDLMTQVHTVLTSPPYFRKRRYGSHQRELGHESSIEAYLNKLVMAFNAVPLHPQGSLWVNLGDTRDPGTGNLLMVPERFARAMQTEGWNLVDSIIWAKVEVNDDSTISGHCMVEPAEKRLNGNGYEHLYRFTRCRMQDAWTDAWAVMVPRHGVQATRYLPKELMRTETSTNGRCLQNVWRVGYEAMRQRHYAPYPAALCERPIAMTCPMNVCRTCGHIRTRRVQKQLYDEQRSRRSRIFGKYTSGEGQELVDKAGRRDAGRNYAAKMPVTAGWDECPCQNWRPGVVLDPFCGSGTTGEIALRMGRCFIGIDLYALYLDITRMRCEQVLQWLEEKKLNPAALER